MSSIKKIFVLALIGILAGIASWSLIEMILYFQSSFSSYFLFTACIGLLLGVVNGAFFGSGEGITLGVPKHIIYGILTGTLVGFFGGGIGFLLGQEAVFLLGELLQNSKQAVEQFAHPISRAVGWSIVGIFIGSVEGVRAWSWRKLKAGWIGGWIGGLIGGLVFEYTQLFFPQLVVARLFGLILFGALIGIGYGLAESQLSRGMLKILNGPRKGKEILLIQKKTKLGSSTQADILLQEYQNVAPLHAEFTLSKSEIIIHSTSPNKETRVNEDPIQKVALKMNDVIQIGSVKLLYFYK